MVFRRARGRRVDVAAAIVGLVGGILAISWIAAGSDEGVRIEAQVVTVVYGDAPSTFGRLHLPAMDSPSRARVVVLVHGGFWRRRGGDLGLMEPLATDLAARGYAVWNIEYGRTGERRGGWPHTFEHMSLAVEHLHELANTYPIDPNLVSIVGHSAGGHLALWVVGRGSTDVHSVVALAPIVDLRLAAEDRLGNGAVVDLLGGTPDEVPERYEEAEPVLVDSVRTRLVLGGADDIVLAPYSQLPGADVVVVAGTDHLALIDPDGLAWPAVLEWIESDVRE